MEKESLDVYCYDSYPDFAFGLDRDPLHSDDLNDRKWSHNLAEIRSICLIWNYGTAVRWKWLDNQNGSTVSASGTVNSLGNAECSSWC